MSHNQYRCRSWVVVACVAVGCGGSDASGTSPTVATPVMVSSAAAGAGGNSPPRAGASAAGAAAVAGSAASASLAGTSAPAPSAGSAAPAPGAGGSASPPSGGAAAPAAPVGALPPFTGPVDGDPAKPMVSIPGVPCGVPTVSFGAVPPTVKIGNRDVAVAYPCAHEGAAVTFFLFVHGTLQEEQKIQFTMNAYGVHKLVDSHNVIVITPKAVGTQWGNMDNGVDLPHLHEVVQWVYATFGEKFNIRSMWAHGGSWGAFYLSTFACDAMLEDKLRGVFMVVGGGCPRCSDRLSCVVIQQELEKGMGMTLPPAEQEMLADAANVAPFATQHGCDAKLGPMNVGNVRTWDWPNCDPGWMHSYYLGPGEHADTLDSAAVLKLTDGMKATEN